MNYFSRLVKRPCFKVERFCFLVLLFCSVQPAGAALITAGAVIDWSTFKITPIDIGNGLPTLTWITQNDSSNANSNASCYYYGCGVGVSEYASSWSAGTLATESSANSIANRSASAATSGSQIKADASINGSFVDQYYVNPSSNSQRSGGFTVQGNGLLLFQANYSLADNLGVAASGTASSGVNFSLSSNGDGGYGSANQGFNRAISNGSAPIAETGILTVGLIFGNGWGGYFTGSTNASVSSYGSVNSIPLPAAFWLFGSALAGFAGLRRHWPSV
ncbi:MAG: VPLPA-CTERM sorting domain-containing protein [Methylococcaceae bacterium]|nr:VPLPA-CTERM sorting domain-containing protein [Methylococcaceae bacterium]